MTAAMTRAQNTKPPRRRRTGPRPRPRQHHPARIPRRPATPGPRCAARSPPTPAAGPTPSPPPSPTSSPSTPASSPRTSKPSAPETPPHDRHRGRDLCTWHRTAWTTSSAPPAPTGPSGLRRGAQPPSARSSRSTTSTWTSAPSSPRAPLSTGSSCFQPPDQPMQHHILNQIRGSWTRAFSPPPPPGTSARSTPRTSARPTASSNPARPPDDVRAIGHSCLSGVDRAGCSGSADHRHRHGLAPTHDAGRAHRWFREHIRATVTR
ncbi:hypothetical protein ABH937_004234 [Kitasatospora sp. GAS1066B]